MVHQVHREFQERRDFLDRPARKDLQALVDHKEAKDLRDLLDHPGSPANGAIWGPRGFQDPKARLDFLVL